MLVGLTQLQDSGLVACMFNLVSGVDMQCDLQFLAVRTIDH